MEDITTIPADDLEKQVRSVLKHAVDAYREDLKVYESLQNLNEVIGTEYGDRVLYELIQNAHDANSPDGKGRIAIQLVIHSDTEGILYVANDGNGFRKEDVEAIKNLATSAKEVGEGIGNKGLGFRSIEALTDDVHIFSRKGADPTGSFDGYCFRFAQVSEIEDILLSYDVNAATRIKVAKSVPRYLVPRPLTEQPDDIAAYARRGYATVIAAPLRTAEAVALACRQVEGLTDLDAPLLLFLDRIAEIKIDIERPEQKPYRRRLHRRQTDMGYIPLLAGTRMYEVNAGEERRFLVVQREVNKERVLNAVKNSVSAAPQLKRWLNWKGVPVVSVAVGLTKQAVISGRLYNFLPMGEEATSPLLGYLDAPFFADINRRDADLNLPLNETLMEVAAESCAAAVLSIVERDLPIPAQTVFDLFAWTGEQARKLDKAFKETGSSLREARVIPAIADKGRKAWSNLSEISIWPKGSFSVLKDREVAKRTDAQLVLSDLDSSRIERLRKIGQRIYQLLTPSRTKLAEWMEAYARSLVGRNVAPHTWSHFYDDVVSLFDVTGWDLEALAGRRILIDRTGKLQPAGGHGDHGKKGLYVRSEDSKGKRKSQGIPVPPAKLTRRYRFLHDKVRLKHDTLEAFVEADLVRQYDPVEVLASLKFVLGRKVSEARHLEALLWAFRVWRTAGNRVESILREAELFVPSLSGWRPAEAVAFSASWTTTGRMLENFLFEAASLSSDCQRTSEGLLIGYQNWPGTKEASKRHWIEFLEIIGVANGLKPITSRFNREGTPAYYWNGFVRDGNAAEGFDEDWCAEVEDVSFSNPYTDRQAEGEAWRFPGQMEHSELSEIAKEDFCTLVFEYLRDHGDSCFYFRVGKFNRPRRGWDAVYLPTPLATFLRSKPWVAVDIKEGITFQCPDECWGARSRKARPPRFIGRLPEAALGVLENEERYNLIFGEEIGIRDWQDKETAIDRLRVLGSIAPDIWLSERPRLRDECRRAWLEVCEGSFELPEDLTLAVNRNGQLESLVGDPNNPPSVVVTQDGQRADARILMDAGFAILDVGDGSVEEIARSLEAAGCFSPQLIDGTDIELFVDGTSFVPSELDDRLISLGLDWLPEVAVIANQIRGERLERGIPNTHIERRARAIRLRKCDQFSLIVGGAEVSTSEHLHYWAYEHGELPTLIVTERLQLTWQTLALQLCNPISRLIDPRLRALKHPLHRLALRDPSGELERPSDEMLAFALECDVQTIKEHRLALQSDTGRILEILIPVVGYYGGLELAAALEADAERAGIKFDPLKWLEENLSSSSQPATDLLAACEQASDRREVRRILDLNFAEFNKVLLGLGEPPITNEDELRQLYGAYLAKMSGGIFDRLRRRYLNNYRTGGDITAYVEYKSLAFLPFNKEWIFTREEIDMDLVEHYVSTLLDEILGPDIEVKLSARNRVVESNRKTLRSFANEAMPVIHAWCRRNDITVPEFWQHDDIQALVRQMEERGLLDFEIVAHDKMAELCLRAGYWPQDMLRTIDRLELGLEASEVEEEKRRRKEERHRLEVARRTIMFGSTDLDTGDERFAERLKEITDEALSADESWFERSSRRVRLVEFLESDRSHGGGGRGRGKGSGRRQQLTEAVRSAMGLASELLAFEYLRRRHPDYMDETCWISENRENYLGGDEGNDAAGYDFIVKTPQADWMYEVKSSLEESGEFELTANELRVASGASKDGRWRYRILYVPYVFSPDKWCVLELPNPMGDKTRNRFSVVGHGTLRLRFERQ